MHALPIDTLLPELQATLADGAFAVLTAEPGAGKTTRVPLALLEAPWLAGRRIIMLEPRRLAARAAARFMANSLGEEVGQTVGYRVRMDSRVSDATRIEVVTEGILTRILQDDPALSAYGAVIFDEFHERNLHADLGLAFTLEACEALREDLRVLVMSATLDAARVAALMPGAAVLSSPGRSFPVVTRHAPVPRGGEVPEHAARIARELMASEAGSALVFLPGKAEIRRAARALEGRLPADVDLFDLSGDLAPEAQDAAIAPSPPGRRKLVLATAVAESSLTIEGIRLVVDAGLMRGPRFDPVSGLTRLETTRVSRDSADQRRGRAGRLEPGICVRLWSEGEDQRLQASRPPEILNADLAPLALELANWGAEEGAQLAWMDPPAPAAMSQARELLAQLGALQADGRISAHGRKMLALPVHPRLAHMLLKAAEQGRGGIAAWLAALLEERDPLPPGSGADVERRLRALTRESREISPARRQFLARAANTLARRLGARAAIEGVENAGAVLALAYPDRIAHRRTEGGNRYLLANGRGAVLDEADPLRKCEWLVAAHLDGQAREARIFLAGALDAKELEAVAGSLMRSEEQVEWDAAARCVRAVERKCLGAIVLAERALTHPDPEAVAACLMRGIRAAGLEALPWTPALQDKRERVQFLHRVLGPPWPDMRDERLLEQLESWLGPYLAGLDRLAKLDAGRLGQALDGLLPPNGVQQLKVLAPERLEVPSGSSLKLDYSGEQPVLAVRIQEVFGMPATPRVAGARVPVVLHLLSPARRPVQVTSDLASFWARGYAEVKKDLKGRYPKHYWPDDPLEAEARRGTRPRN